MWQKPLHWSKFDKNREHDNDEQESMELNTEE